MQGKAKVQLPSIEGIHKHFMEEIALVLSITFLVKPSDP